MHERHTFRYWIAAGIVLIVIVGYALPRHVTSGVPSSPAAEATVPSQLLAGDQSPTAGEQSPTPAPTQIAVYVCGDVRRPGVYRFGAGFRVADGIARAGGARDDADLEQLNLAQPLNDAMKIDVPKKGQLLAAASALTWNASPGLGTADQGPRRRSAHRSGRSSHKLQPGQSLDVNTATELELTALPGVGPGLARRIVEYRTANGPFQSVDDLQNVSGIGPSKLELMAPYIRL